MQHAHEAKTGNHSMKHHQHDTATHHKMMIADFKKRFFVSLVFTFPILALSPLIQGFLSYELTFSGDYSLLLACSAFVFFYGGWPFLKVNKTI